MTITLKEFDRLLAEHCAPTLKGLKAANTFQIDTKGAFHDLRKIMEEYNTILNNDGIYLEVVDEEEGLATILVYNKAMVAERLGSSQTKETLSALGLKSDLTVDSIVSVVRAIKHRGGDLPELVKGYLNCNGGKQAEYAACSRDFVAQMEQGANLMSIIRQGQ